MSGRYEVQNRYSAYIEARRNYLEQSESEEDVEIRTILRRPQQSYFRTRTVSTSSEEPTTQPAMVLVPTVTIQEAPVEIPPSEPIEPTPSSSVVQEIHVEGIEEKPLELPSAEPECSVCTKVVDTVKPIYENVKAKYQKFVDWITDPALHASIRSEFVTYAPSILLTFALFLFLITAVSICKLLKNGPQTEPTFFCKYFSAPFAPLFDALCAPEPFVFADELPRVMGGLVDEILITLSEFFRTIGKGFTVFGTLFTAISNGLSENVFFGFHELGENLGENISHLLHFVVQFFHQILHLILSSIATVAGAIAGVFTSVHDYLEPQPVL